MRFLTPRRDEETFWFESQIATSHTTYHNDNDTIGTVMRMMIITCCSVVALAGLVVTILFAVRLHGRGIWLVLLIGLGSFCAISCCVAYCISVEVKMRRLAKQKNSFLVM